MFISSTLILPDKNKPTISSRELAIEEMESGDISRFSTIEERLERAIETEAFGKPPYVGDG